MDLSEHQGNEFFAQYGMPVSPGEAAFSVDEAVAAAERLGTPVMVKAQVHTGGRGKAGGVKFAADIDAVREHAGNILGLDIKGHIVKRIWIEKASDIAEEYYASFTLDRSAKKHLGMLSKEGGVEIEEVAAKHPEAGDGAIYAWITHRDYVDNRVPSGVPKAMDRGRVQYLFRAAGPRLSNPTNYDIRTALEGQLGRHLARHLPARTEGTPRPLVVLGSYAYVRAWRDEELSRCVDGCKVTGSDNLGFVPKADGALKKLLKQAAKEVVPVPPPSDADKARTARLAATACGCGAARVDGACPPAFEPKKMKKACTLRARKPVVCQCPD